MNQQAQSNLAIPIYQPDEKYDFLSSSTEASLWYISAACASGPNVCTEEAIECVSKKFLYVSKAYACWSVSENELENGLSDGDADGKEDDDDLINDDDDNDDDDDDDDDDVDDHDVNDDNLDITDAVDEAIFPFVNKRCHF